MKDECRKCSGKGTYRSMDIVEGNKIIVDVKCPHCEDELVKDSQ